MFDICVVGHVTRDLNSIAGIRQPPSPGGAAFFAAMAYQSLGLKTLVVTKTAPEDEDELLADLRAAGVEVVWFASRRSLQFENIYPSSDLDLRVQRVASVADPFEPAEIASVRARIFHFGPLTRWDISPSLLRAAARTGALVAMDAQGVLRDVRDGAVRRRPWDHLKEALRWVTVVQGDREEIRLLAQDDDSFEAARRLAALGPNEVLVTDGSRGSHAYGRRRFERIPACPPRRLIDATGCGDSHLAGYLARRLTSDDVRDCASFAASLASLKLECLGPFRGTEAEILARRSEAAAPRPRRKPIASRRRTRTPGLYPLGEEVESDGSI